MTAWVSGFILKPLHSTSHNMKCYWENSIKTVGLKTVGRICITVKHVLQKKHAGEFVEDKIVCAWSACSECWFGDCVTTSQQPLHEFVTLLPSLIKSPGKYRTVSIPGVCLWAVCLIGVEWSLLQYNKLTLQQCSPACRLRRFGQCRLG